jgi:hypothetical protein
MISINSHDDDDANVCMWVNISGFLVISIKKYSYGMRVKHLIFLKTFYETQNMLHTIYHADSGNTASALIFLL